MVLIWLLVRLRCDRGLIPRHGGLADPAFRHPIGGKVRRTKARQCVFVYACFRTGDKGGNEPLATLLFYERLGSFICFDFPTNRVCQRVFILCLLVGDCCPGARHASATRLALRSLYSAGCRYNAGHAALLQQPTLLRIRPLLGADVCSKRFHRHYSGQSGL